MACNATRIELSNSATTTVQITLATWEAGDPELSVTLQVDELSIAATGTTSSGVATLTIAAVSAANNSLWDATLQVGNNRIATAGAQVVETNVAQTVGITIDDTDVTYCAPTAGGGGGGDALTSGTLAQFSDVTYGTIRESDILARSSTGQWNNQRPEYLRVDRRPMIGAWYAAQEVDAGFGVLSQSWRKTPSTGEDMTNPTTNGKLDFVQDMFELNTVGANGKMQYGFERYIIGNPAGLHLNNAEGYWHYPACAGSGLTLTQSVLLAADGVTEVETLPTAFTDNGLTSGTPGDNVEAWQAAIEYLRDLFTFDSQTTPVVTKRNPIEVAAYVGYKPQYLDDAQTQYERTALGVNPLQTRSEFSGAWDDGFWSVEWAILQDVGFDTLGFDTGGRMWFDSGVEGRSIIDGCIDTINDKFFVEAIARQSGGLQEVDTRCYENVRSLTIFPQLASIEYDGEEWTGMNGVNEVNNGSIRCSQWKLDRYKTECHVLFNWYDIKEDARFTKEVVIGCAREAHRRGFVVGVYNAIGSATLQDGSGFNAADLCKLVEDLYLESVEESRLDMLADVDAPAPADGEVLTWNATSGFWEPTAVSGTGTVTSVGLNVPGGFTVVGTNPITASGTFEITSTLSGVIKADGAATFSGSAELNDLADVNVAQGAGNDGDLVFYDHAAGAGAKFKGVARSSIGLSEFNDDLPAVQDSYLMLIEAPTDKTYIIDGRVAAGRTVTNFYAKTSSGTCTATLKNVTDTTTIGTISVTSTGGSAASLTNTSVTENERLSIEISSNSSAADLELVVEYTQ
jgi:hypothetical protein